MVACRLPVTVGGYACLVISNNYRAHWLTSLVALIAATALLASCGSGDDTTDDATESSADAATESDSSSSEATTTEETTATTAATTAPTTASTATTAAEAANGPAGTPAAVVVAFTDCIERTGVEVPDLTLDSDGMAKLGDVLRSLDIENPATQLALFGCQSSLDQATGGGLNKLLTDPALQDALTDFSGCVRDGGFDVPDLTVAGALGSLLGGSVGGGTDELLSGMLGLDLNDPAVSGVIDSCGDEIEDQLADLGL